MFQTASSAKPSALSVFVSLLLHSAGILLVGLIGFSDSPRQLSANEFPRAGWPLARTVLIAPRPLETPARRAAELPPRRVRPFRRLQTHPPRSAQLHPKPIPDLPPAPVLDLVRVPLPAPELPRLVSPPVHPPAPPAIQTGTFARGENAGAGIRQRRLIATGGFETASPGETAAPRRTVTLASGFATERAAPAASAARPAIRAGGGFGDASAAEAAAASHRTATPAAVGATIPAEILDKPRPSYPDEARRLHIEGEVLLDVVFEASGQVKVVRVVRGLGHGLDEAAKAAAGQIHFRPAERDGVAIDSSAVMHILFQLAY